MKCEANCGEMKRRPATWENSGKTAKKQGTNSLGVKGILDVRVSWTELGFYILVLEGNPVQTAQYDKAQ